MCNGYMFVKSLFRYSDIIDSVNRQIKKHAFGTYLRFTTIIRGAKVSAALPIIKVVLHSFTLFHSLRKGILLYIIIIINMNICLIGLVLIICLKSFS